MLGAVLEVVFGAGVILGIGENVILPPLDTAKGPICPICPAVLTWTWAFPPIPCIIDPIAEEIDCKIGLTMFCGLGVGVYKSLYKGHINYRHGIYGRNRLGGRSRLFWRRILPLNVYRKEIRSV